MADDLRLRVVLNAINNASAPLRQIQAGSQEAARSIQAARQRLRELNTQQRDIAGWRQQSTQARQTSQSFDAARERVKQMARQMAATANPTQQMNAEFQAAIRAAAELKRKHEQEQQALQGLRQRLGEAGIDTRRLNQHSARLREEMERANQVMRDQEARLRRLAALQERAAQARGRLERSQARAGAMVATGAAGVATSGGLIATGATLVAPQVEVGHQGSMIAAQNGEDASRSDQYKAMISSMRTDGLSTDIGEISTAVGAAKSTLSALGPVADKELESAARKALDLSKVMGIDVAEAMQTVGIMMQNGLAKDSTEAFDLLTAGLQKIPQQMRGEIPEILHEYSTHFRGMGFSGAEAMNLLVEQAKQGKFALDKTGDAIKEFSIRGSDLSKTSREAYASIGLDAEKMSSAIAKGGPGARDAILKTAKALQKIKDPAERANAAIALFGTPVEDLSVDQIPAFLEKLNGGTKALGDFGGAAGKMGSALRDNLSGDLDKLTGAWAGLIGSLMDGENGALRDLVQQVTAVLGSVREWIAANPELASKIAKGAAAVAVLIGGMGALTVALASMLGPFAMIRYGMTMFGVRSAILAPTLGKLAGVMKGGLLTAIRVVGTALWGLTANPVALAIAAVVVALAGAAYLIYQNWDAVKAYFINAWAEIKAGFSGGITGILSVLINFNPMGLIYQAFAGVLNYLGLDLPMRFTEFGSMIVNGLVNGLTSGLGMVKDAVSSLGDGAIGWFKEKLGIHSPSRVFAELGGFTTEGLAQGLDAGAKLPLDAMNRISQQLTSTGIDIKPPVPTLAQESPVRAAADLVTARPPSDRPGLGKQLGAAAIAASLAVTTAPAIAVDDRPPIASAPAASYDSHDVVNINIHPAPGMDPQAIARAVSAELDRRDREKSARQRSRLSDSE
ncbi:phage tail tape measure protein [Pseudomonas sp. Irchel 3E13]|uniref:phage tail tape measure protein n=1 Tax=Pseudomonas sp. Irchel 3E13 TaxID=2008975 RepID=UPI000BA350A0|nr:phage tail tape measure protein [Pseudomonas sp. Irchel 3E13]